MTGPSRAVAATRLAVRRALKQLALPAQSERPLVFVACSGGADSLALAAAVAFEAPRAQVSAGALIVDHGLQEGSAAVAERAAAQCRQLGLSPVEVVRVTVGSAGSSDPQGAGPVPGSGSGPEARARDARYAAFEGVIERRGAAAVLLGHTRDDQAEQVLLGLARGSGARSLSGMPARRGPYVRPLLGLDRGTTMAACEAAGLTAWVDPHNSDPAYTRVRARALLVVLEAELGPGTIAALARSADLLRDDADALDDLAIRARHELVPQGHRGIEAEPLRVEAEPLRGLPKAIRTRVWRLLALEAGCPPGALVSSHIDALDTLVTSWQGQGPIDLPGQVQASRADGRVLLTATRPVE